MRTNRSEYLAHADLKAGAPTVRASVRRAPVVKAAPVRMGLCMAIACTVVAVMALVGGGL